MEGTTVDWITLAREFGLPLTMLAGGLWAVLTGRVMTTREVAAREAQIQREREDHAADRAEWERRYQAMVASYDARLIEGEQRYQAMVAAYESRLARLESLVSQWQGMFMEVVGATKALARTKDVHP